jgi:hypothetical protein
MSVRAYVVAVALLVACPTARAQGEGVATHADQLFQDGVRLMREDKCPEAIAKFARSQELDPSTATLVNLATCYTRVGRTASAYKTYQTAAGAAEKDGNAELKERALKALGILEPQITKLRIVVPERARPITVRVNGEVVDTAAPVPIDPGETTIEAEAQGRETWRHTVTAEGNGATIVVQLPEPPSPSPASAPAPEPQPWWTTSRKVAAVAGGVGVVGLGVGTVLGLSAMSKYDESNQYCVAGHCNQQGHDLRAGALTKADVSTVVTVIGAAAVVGGAVIWLTSPFDGKTKVGVSPWGLSVEGRL